MVKQHLKLNLLKNVKQHWDWVEKSDAYKKQACNQWRKKL